mgnify:FL=1|jgi:hypothetical protein|tara:strand:- start:476 stop:640 length:165 start_codon:yes stop_codon:yes gene_type:complete
MKVIDAYRTRWSLTTLITFYEQLLKEGKVQINGAASSRLKQLREKKLLTRTGRK